MDRRIDRALSQPLYILDLDEDKERVHISGLTNSYHIRLDRRRQSHTCSCPDFSKRDEMCKHLAYVYLRVFKLSRADIVEAHGFPDLTRDTAELKTVCTEKLTEAECPICYDDFDSSGHRPVVLCTRCGKPFHDDCIQVWTREHDTCPMCRKMWQQGK